MAPVNPLARSDKTLRARPFVNVVHEAQLLLLYARKPHLPIAFKADGQESADLNRVPWTGLLALRAIGPLFQALGCAPGRCGNMSKHPIMNAAMTDDAIGRLNARPPSATGLSRKSPTVAPSGRVRMKATQKSVTRDTLVQE